MNFIQLDYIQATHGGNMSSLKDMRKLRGLSQAELAKRVRLSIPRISILEKRGIYDIRTAQKYAIALDCNPLFLLERLNKIQLNKPSIAKQEE